MTNNILVVEDEEDILELIKYNLEQEGLKVSGFATGEIGLEKAKETKPDLIILDIMLPGLSGLEVCEEIRKDTSFSNTPIILVSAKGEETDIIRGLELGADDYITKPFSPRVLVARVKACLRRNSKVQVNNNESFSANELYLNPGRFLATLKGEELELTASEFKVLQFLARHPGWVFTRHQIVEELRGSDYPVTPRAVDVQIVGLRKKLGECGHYIETVRGVGYRFKE